MDFEKARYNMVEQQIRTWDVLDSTVLDLLFAVKRENFVPAEHRALAFVDMEIPIGHGQRMMAPKMEARIVQELTLKPTDSVFEVGTGSGYMAALLASLTERVTSGEIFPELSLGASAKLKAAGIHNVELRVGDFARGVGGSEGYDVIVLTGSTPVMPQAFLTALKPGGRAFAVIGDAPVMKATLFTKDAGGAVTSTEVFETVLTPLIHAQTHSRFTF